jgi:hypothetical protein
MDVYLLVTVAAGILVDKQQTPQDDVISYIDVM